MVHDTKILFLHGINGSKFDFTYLIDEFDSDQVIAFDLPGFGEAKKPKTLYDKDFFLTYIKKYIKEPVIIVGHSMGAMLAKDFALAYPTLVKKVFLISYPFDEHIKHFERNNLTVNQTNKILYLIHEFLFNHKYFDSARAKFASTENSRNSTLRDYIHLDLKDDIQKIIDKTTFIFGSKDPHVSQEYIEEFCPIYIKNMGHSFYAHEKEIAGIIKSDIGL